MRKKRKKDSDCVMGWTWMDVKLEYGDDGRMRYWRFVAEGIREFDFDVVEDKARLNHITACRHHDPPPPGPSRRLLQGILPATEAS